MTRINKKKQNTTSEQTFQSKHRLIDEIVIYHGNSNIIASPLKQVIDRPEDSRSTVKVVKNTQAQNSYTNILLHAMTNN